MPLPGPDPVVKAEIIAGIQHQEETHDSQDHARSTKCRHGPAHQKNYQAGKNSEGHADEEEGHMPQFSIDGVSEAEQEEQVEQQHDPTGMDESMRNNLPVVERRRV